MRTDEAVIKIISKLDSTFGNTLDQQKTRQIVEGVLYNYVITPKETLPAIIDNMNDMILLYLAVKKTENLTDTTIKNYGRNLGRFADYIRKNVDDVTAMDIRVYLSKRGKLGLKPSTIAADIDILRGYFNWLEDEDYIIKSPMHKIKTPKVEKRLREALTKEQLEILRTGAKTLRQKALLELFYSTGCRLEEVERMKKSDIDWQRLSMKVIGKGNKQRTVYINATCLVHLKKYLISRTDDNPALFVTERSPIKFMGKRAIQREIKKIGVQSGLDIDVYPHILRHTFATHMLNNGMSLTVLQEIMGHDSSETTLVYASLNNQTVESEYRKYG